MQARHEAHILKTMDIKDFGRRADGAFGAPSEKPLFPEEMEKLRGTTEKGDGESPAVEREEEAFERGDEKKSEAEDGRTSLRWEREENGEYHSAKGTIKGHEVYLRRDGQNYYGTIDGMHISGGDAKTLYEKHWGKHLSSLYENRTNVTIPERRRKPRQENESSDHSKIDGILRKIL